MARTVQPQGSINSVESPVDKQPAVGNFLERSSGNFPQILNPTVCRAIRKWEVGHQ